MCLSLSYQKARQASVWVRRFHRKEHHCYSIVCKWKICLSQNAFFSWRKIFHMCYSPIPDTQRSLGKGCHRLERSRLLQPLTESWTGSLERLGMSVSVCPPSHGHQVRFRHSSCLLTLWMWSWHLQHLDIVCLWPAWTDKLSRGLKDSRIWSVPRVQQSPEAMSWGGAWKSQKTPCTKPPHYSTSSSLRISGPCAPEPGCQVRWHLSFPKAKWKPEGPHGAGRSLSFKAVHSEVTLPSPALAHRVPVYASPIIA